MNPWVIGTGTAVIAGVILYFVLPKNNSVSKNNQTVSVGGDMNNSIIARDVNIINPLPKPKIIEKRIVIMNSSYNGRYKTRISVTIANPPSNDASIIPKGPANSTCKLIPQSSGNRISQSGSFPYKSYIIDCITDEIAKEGDFNFSIKQ